MIAFLIFPSAVLDVVTKRMSYIIRLSAGINSLKFQCCFIQ